MGWFNKKEKVPEIPPAPQLPELPSPPSPDKKELPELPAFQPTENKHQENLNQNIVKSAVSDTDNEISHSSEDNEVKREAPSGGFHPNNPQGMLPSLPPIHSQAKPPIHDRKRAIELSPSIKQKDPTTKQIEPIFVRIDKYQEAQKDFDEIKKKIKNIESVLRKIKDKKVKEDLEIASWNEELEKIKSRLSEIDSNIFDQI